MSSGQWKPYVPVAQRRAKAKKVAKKVAKKTAKKAAKKNAPNATTRPRNAKGELIFTQAQTSSNSVKNLV